MGVCVLLLRWGFKKIYPTPNTPQSLVKRDGGQGDGSCAFAVSTNLIKEPYYGGVMLKGKQIVPRALFGVCYTPADEYCSLLTSVFWLGAALSMIISTSAFGSSASPLAEMTTSEAQKPLSLSVV